MLTCCETCVSIESNSMKSHDKTITHEFQPLAARLRPKTLSQFIGQAHLLGDEKPLKRAISQGALHSMILWGPPGSGKTTLAELMTMQTNASFQRISAILTGIKEIKQIIETAQEAKKTSGTATVLFIDEIHRFNKAQQDVFLPFIENGTLIVIGATTENPSFEINHALLSRLRVYVLKRLSQDDLLHVLNNALTDKENGLGMIPLVLSDDIKLLLVQLSDGDARQLLNLLDIIAALLPDDTSPFVITPAFIADIVQTTTRQFDKGGDTFHDLISALHKSVRGSSPDAALYWFACMLQGGCDPRYLGRRMIRMASEDIGNADPRALEITLAACDTYERLGSPEGELALAQAITYLAVAPKSNAIYTAYQAAMEAAKRYGSQPVPLHLRNAPTKLMKQLGAGKEYRYPHDEKEAYAVGVSYFPDEMKKMTFYHPTGRGLEAKIAERLKYLASLEKERTN